MPCPYFISDSSLQAGNLPRIYKMMSQPSTLLLKPPFVRDLSRTVDESSNFKPGGVKKESRG